MGAWLSGDQEIVDFGLERIGFHSICLLEVSATIITVFLYLSPLAFALLVSQIGKPLERQFR